MFLGVYLMGNTFDVEELRYRLGVEILAKGEGILDK